MTTIAWLMIITGLVLIRQVAKGRTFQTAEDLRDMFVGLVSADWSAIQDVLDKTGEKAYEPIPEGAVEEATGQIVQGAKSSAIGAAMIQKMKSLAAAANYKYVWGATGPNGYDCSGIVWRAMKELGLYSGPRFTTFTFPSLKNIQKISSPVPGAIVVWDRGSKGHMGIVTGNDRFFSALSSKSGIKEAKMSAITGKVSYYQILGSHTGKGSSGT